MIDFAGQTTAIALITAAAVTTAAPDVYGTEVDITGLAGGAIAIENTGGTQSTGGSMTVKVQAGYKTVEAQQTTVTPAFDIEIADATRTTVATKFTPTAACSIKECYFRLKKQGTADGAVSFNIMTDNSGKPSNTVIDIATATISATTLSTDYAWVKVTFTTLPDLTSGTAYHFAIMGGYSAHADNNVAYNAQTAASGGNYTFYTNSWSNNVATLKPCFKAIGYNWGTLGTPNTVGAPAGITTTPFNTDFCGGNYIRGVAQVTAGDGSTSYKTSMVLIGQPQQGI